VDGKEQNRQTPVHPTVTNCMGHTHSASQEIHCLLLTRRFLPCSKEPATSPHTEQHESNPDTCVTFKIILILHFDLPMSPKRSHTFSFSDQDAVRIFVYRMLSTWTAQLRADCIGLIRVWTMAFILHYCSLFPLWSKYFPQRPVLRHHRR
jgi:hypothetical protein